MIRNPEQTIGKLADNAGYAVCTFIDEQGYPETQTLPQPLRREGIRFRFDALDRFLSGQSLLHGSTVLPRRLLKRLAHGWR